jgi:hypothetical protein
MSDQMLTREVVEEAYTWGLGIVAMYRYTEKMGTRVDGINQVFHNRGLFEPGQLPGGANRDTLYSFGWFDLADGPYVVSLPDFGGRYFVWQMTDVYARNFHNVGNGLLEGPAERYGSGYSFVVAGPGWDGVAPEGMDVVKSPARLVNVLFRIQVLTDPADIAVGNRLQDAVVTVPLSEWEAGAVESKRSLPNNPAPTYRDVVVFGQGTTGKDQRNPDYFTALAEVIAADPPYTEWDQAMVDGPLAAMGVKPGEAFDLSTMDETTREMILDAQQAAYDKVMAMRRGGYGPIVNGWQFGPPAHGNWQDDFARRAFSVTMGGMWPVPNNSTYAFAFTDINGEDMTGADDARYRVHIDGDNLPPATVFWSLTVYEAGTFDLYPNDAELYMVGSNNPATKRTLDGSIDVEFSATPPDNPEVNWIPVPEDLFWVGIRFYAPTPEVLAVEYETPGIVKTNPPARP